MTRIDFKTPNSRRQAEDWLFRHCDEEPVSGLLHIEVENEMGAELLSKEAEDYVLVLPIPPVSSCPEIGIIWRAPQVGSYGLYQAEMILIGETFFHICSSNPELIRDIRSFLTEGFHGSKTPEELSEKVTFSRSGKFTDVRKKKGVKL